MIHPTASRKKQSKRCANVAASGRLFGDAEAEQAVDSVDRSKALMLLGSPGWNFSVDFLVRQLRSSGPFNLLTLTFWVLVLDDIE